MDFSTKTNITPWHRPLRHSDKLMVMGSCFAEHIGERLERMKFRSIINPYGVLYNPLSITEGLIRLIEQRPFTEKELHEFPDGGWNTWMHHSRYSQPDKHAALTAINHSLENAAKRLAEADVLILTLGTAWAYRLAETNEVVGNCHKIPERQFVRQRLQVNEIIDAFNKVIDRLSKINPNLRILFTVSPVRHLKDGLHGNQLSKATLLLAVDELCQEHPQQCHYFPAYEIVLDELRDYRFYANDMAHPSPLAIDYVWERFAEHCIEKEAQSFMLQWEKICSGMEHRPFNPQAEKYKQFIEQIIEKIEELKRQYPYIEVEKDINRCYQMIPQSSGQDKKDCH